MIVRQAQQDDIETLGEIEEQGIYYSQPVEDAVVMRKTMRIAIHSLEKSSLEK